MQDRPSIAELLEHPFITSTGDVSMQSPTKPILESQLTINTEGLSGRDECVDSELSTHQNHLINGNIAPFSPQRASQSREFHESCNDGLMTRAVTAAATHSGDSAGGFDVLSPSNSRVCVGDYSAGFDDGVVTRGLKGDVMNQEELSEEVLRIRGSRNYENEDGEFGKWQTTQRNNIPVNGNYDNDMSIIEESECDLNTISASNSLSNALGRPVAPLSSEKLDSFNSHFNPAPSPIMTR